MNITVILIFQIFKIILKFNNTILIYQINDPFKIKSALRLFKDGMF